MAEINTGVNLEIIKKAFEKPEKSKGVVIPSSQEMSGNNSNDESPKTEQQQNSVFPNLKLTPPMAMSSVDSTGKTTMVSNMINADVSTHLSKNLSTGAYFTGMNSFRASQPMMESSLTYMPMSMGNASAYTTAKITPDLKLYAQEGIDYNTDFRGHNTQQNNSQIGASLSKGFGPVDINATAFKGKSIGVQNGSFDSTPIEGWSIEGKINAGAVSATGKVLETKKAETETRIYQGGLEIERPSVTISANGSVGDTKSPEKTSRIYQGGMSLRFKPVTDKAIQQSVSQKILVDRNLSEAQKMQAIERIRKQETEDYEVPSAPQDKSADYDAIKEAKTFADKKAEAESYGIKVKKTDTMETLQLAIDTKIVDKRLARRNKGTERNVNLFVMADSDNLGNKSKTASLAYMEGNTSFGVDVSSRSLVDKDTGNTSKSNEVRFNVRYTW